MMWSKAILLLIVASSLFLSAMSISVFQEKKIVQDQKPS